MNRPPVRDRETLCIGAFVVDAGGTATGYAGAAGFDVWRGRCDRYNMPGDSACSA